MTSSSLLLHSCCRSTRSSSTQPGLSLVARAAISRLIQFPVLKDGNSITKVTRCCVSASVSLDVSIVHCDEIKHLGCKWCAVTNMPDTNLDYTVCLQRDKSFCSEARNRVIICCCSFSHRRYQTRKSMVPVPRKNSR